MAFRWKAPTSPVGGRRKIIWQSVVTSWRTLSYHWR